MSRTPTPSLPRLSGGEGGRRPIGRRPGEGAELLVVSMPNRVKLLDYFRRLKCYDFSIDTNAPESRIKKQRPLWAVCRRSV